MLRRQGAQRTIVEVSEPSSPDEVAEEAPDEGPSLIARALRRSSVNGHVSRLPQNDGWTERTMSPAEDSSDTSRSPHAGGIEQSTEFTPLLPSATREHRLVNGSQRQHHDLESQKSPRAQPYRDHLSKAASLVAHFFHAGLDVEHGDHRMKWENVLLAPVACLPAVFVGLLLNILDALSYGKRHPHIYHDPACRRPDAEALSRHDSFPPRQPYLRQSRLGRHFHLLREHHHIPASFLLQEHLQRRHRI